MEGREAALTDSVADRLRRLVTEEDSKPAILGRRFRTDGRSELSSVLSWQEACESLRSLEGKFQRGQIVICHGAVLWPCCFRQYVHDSRTPFRLLPY